MKLFFFADGGYSPSNYDQFFLSPQQNQYDKSPAAPGYGGDTSVAANSNQYASYPQQASAVDPYKNANVEDLKTQIYNLQSVINDLNRPEYTQKPEDKQTVYNLEKQISELGNAVNVMSSDKR